MRRPPRRRMATSKNVRRDGGLAIGAEREAGGRELNQIQQPRDSGEPVGGGHVVLPSPGGDRAGQATAPSSRIVYDRSFLVSASLRRFCPCGRRVGGTMRPLSVFASLVPPPLLAVPAVAPAQWIHRRTDGIPRTPDGT